jgi:hypothetical protein
MLTCPICGQQMKGWSRSHLAKHDVSAAQFQALRIEAETTTNTQRTFFI